MAKKGLILRVLGNSVEEVVQSLHEVIREIEFGISNCGADSFDYELVDTDAADVYAKYYSNDPIDVVLGREDAMNEAFRSSAASTQDRDSQP